MISIKIFASGYCMSHAGVANPVEGKGKEKFYATWALANIPNIGYVMYDTGYSNHFAEATKSFPECIYRWITPVTISENETAKSLLKAEGIEANDIKYIVISHFHADHIAGVKDFPNAKFICAKQAFAQMHSLSGFKAVKKGIIHKLLPEDFAERVLLIEDIATNIEVNSFGITEFELFGSSSVKLVLLPGHAKDMLGLLYTSVDNSMLFCSDAAWSYSAYRRRILPRKVVKLFFDSWTDYVKTLNSIKKFEADNSRFKILFTHCKQTLKYISNAI